LRYLPGGRPELIEASTGKPVERLISKVSLEVEAGDIPRAVVECLNMGFDVALTEDQIRFRTGQVIELSPDERINVIAALKALKVVVSGGDGRGAMLQVMATLNAANEKLMSGGQLDRIITRLTPVADKVEPIPESKKEKEKEKEDDFSDVEVPLREQAPTPTRPAGPGPDDNYDPLKGAATRR